MDWSPASPWTSRHYSASSATEREAISMPMNFQSAEEKRKWTYRLLMMQKRRKARNEPDIWTPAALFSAGQQGVWYEPRPEYLFQDAAGTVPVTADGDLVRLMLDISGNGNHATAPSDAARPLYRTDDTLHWLQFDGVDDILQFTPVTTREVWLSVSALSGGGAIVSEGTAGYIRATGSTWKHNDGATSLSSGLDITNPQAISVSYPTTTSSEWLDSAGNLGSVAEAGELEAPQYLMGFSPGLVITGGSLYGVVMVDYIADSAKRVQALNYMAGLSGAPTL